MCSTCGREAGRRLAVERAALVDAEAVLLVDDRDGEPVERHGVLDQRVRADQQLELARSRACRAGRRGGAPGVEPVSSAAGTSSPGISALQRREVLLGERLGGRHQRRLRAVLDRAQHRVQRDHGLAGAHLAHQQPLHRAAGGEVGVDLGHRARAGRRSARTAASRPASGALSVGRAASGSARAPSRRAGAPAQQRELEQQQLLERQPPAAALVVAEVRGAAARRRGRAAARPTRSAAGQRLDDVGERGRGARARARGSAVEVSPSVAG